MRFGYNYPCRMHPFMCVIEETIPARIATEWYDIIMAAIDCVYLCALT
jgi:hypothetical protein